MHDRPTAGSGRHRAPLRGASPRVTALEMFFDLFFVLAVTQCTALMAREPTWTGVLEGLLVLGVVWWSWVGYTWLTSVVDPEDDRVRLLMLGAMASILLLALCVPDAFGDDALLLAGAFAALRALHLVLFRIASADDPALRHATAGLVWSAAGATALLAGAALADGALRIALWAVALALDMGAPYLYDKHGWRLVPAHFAERHGLMILIALGESIVAIGVGAGTVVDGRVVSAALVGIAIAAAFWWLYFDVVALAAARRLELAAPGRERNEMARDSYSYLHFPMIAGTVLVALGLKTTLVDTTRALDGVTATALLGGAAVYLLAHVGFRWRNLHALSAQRLAAAALCGALIPVALAVPALVATALLAAVLVAVIVYERVRFADERAALREQLTP